MSPQQSILLTLVEFLASLLIEGVILTFIFQHIANKIQNQSEQNLQQELQQVEQQNKLIYEQLQLEIRQAKTEIISQIKESEPRKGGQTK